MPARPIFLDDEYEYPVELRKSRHRNRWPPAVRCRYIVVRTGIRCKRFAVRGGEFCREHNANSTYFKNRKKDVVAMQSAREILEAARQAVRDSQVALQLAAPDAVRVLAEIATDPDAATPVRLKAAELLVRHSGSSLERPAPTNVLVVNTGPDAAATIAARLDRLAAALPQTQNSVQGELSPNAAPSN